MLQSVTVDGFKSLRNCTLKLEEKVTCLVGLNGAGKSTLLQAMSFMSALVPASRQKITQSPETKQTLLLKALFNRGFFLAP